MVETVLAQHQSIDHALLEMDELLDTGRWGPLHRSVSAFGALLRAHFDHEERSYLFTDLVEDYPRFAHQIEALKTDHVEMLAEIRFIEEGMDRLPVAVVSARLRALMARLGLHESHEIDLLQHAHTDDIAPVD